MNVDDRARLHEKKKKIEGKQKNQIKRWKSFEWQKHDESTHERINNQMQERETINENSNSKSFSFLRNEKFEKKQKLNN